MTRDRIASWFAVGWSAIVLVGFAVLPVYSSQSSTLSGDTVTRGAATIIAVNGLRILPILGIPLLLSLLVVIPTSPRFHRVLSIAAVVLVMIFVFLGSASVGLYYLPTAIALAIAIDGSRVPAPQG